MLKVRSSALEIRVETIIKCNALDSKAREIIKINKGATPRPTRGLVEIHRTVKVAPTTRRPETTHLSNPMDVSSAVSLTTMLTTAQGAINRHPRGTSTKELIRIHLFMDLHRTRQRRTRVREELIT